MSEEKREPVIIDGYSLGEEGKPEHFDASMSREAAAEAAGNLREGDAAFIKRSDLKWTYALITGRVVEGEVVTLRFDVDKDKNRKSFPQGQWGKYIRVIQIKSAEEKPEEDNKENQVPSTSKPMNKPAAPADVKETVEEAAPAAVPPPTEAAAPVTAPASAPPAAAPAQKSSGGWFSSIFGSTPSPANPTPAPTPKPAETAPEPAPTPAAETKPKAAALIVETSPPDAVKSPSKDESVETPLATFSPPADEVTPAVVNSPSITSESTDNKTIITEKVLKTPVAIKKNPSSILKSFKFSKNRSSAPKEVKTTFDAPKVESKALSPVSEDQKKQVEKFDPEASECDYDKNPTDLFQALEARQFDYAEQMFKQSNKVFVKDCKTWVVARGKNNDKLLRFRALPLHAAIVFGAKDDMVKHILKAYPKAACGRDVKGRLPIHLAYENDSSDDIISLIVEAFPKGFLAKDKKDMTPLDHIKDTSDRKSLKKLFPLVLAAKVEEENEKWQGVIAKKLEEQKAELKNDEAYLADVVEHVHGELQAQHAVVIEELEDKHKRDALELRKKHDSEIQSLLDGFEVKLNFERKLNRIKAEKK